MAWEYSLLLTGLVAFLVAGTLGASALRRWVWPEGNNIVVETLFARINAWWAMVISLSVASLFGRAGITILFFLMSFAALREFLSLTAKRRADHWVLMFSFFVALPAQFLFVGVGWIGMMTVFIPVYTFLFLPVLAVARGDTSHFLARVAETQWGLMLTIFAVSHVPALMLLDIEGFAGKGALLCAWLIIVVQGADVAHYLFPKLVGRHRIMPKLDSSRSWEGMVGALGAAFILGILLWWITPFGLLWAPIIAVLTAFFGYGGNMVMAAIKRDKGVRDWGHLIPGQGGFLDRLDSVFFAAPVFFHLTRFFWG
ncbi:MAG: phosphatidate cytidylyltransferase [Rhodobacterales bacterium]|nr:MAG: phosphatidate cytidylyltransferase [Rhodobacterales bacterium]